MWNGKSRIAAATLGILCSGVFHAAAGDSLTQHFPADASAGDQFGASIAFDGSTAIVGASGNDDNGADSGSAYLFSVASGQELFKVLPRFNNGSAGDRFGQAVAIDGPTAIVGAPFDEINGDAFGAAYIVEVSSGVSLVRIFPQNGSVDGRFGSSVAINGNTIIVGAPFDNNGVGAVYIFRADFASQLFKIFDALPGGSSIFGTSVAVSGTTAVVGAFGVAFIFDTDTGNQRFRLEVNNAIGLHNFGNACAISGTTAIIGAYRDDDLGSQAGSAFVFDTETGLQLLKLLPTDGEGGDQFGESVAISGNVAIIGAGRDNENGFRSGSAYLFDITTGQQLAKILPINGQISDIFGSAVAISESIALIGAPGETAVGASSGYFSIFDPDTSVSIAQQPSCVNAVDAGSSPLMIGVSAVSNLPLQFQWRFDGQPLVNSASYTGTTTDTLTIVPSPATEGVYELVMSNVFSSIVSDVSGLLVNSTLTADINGDGVVDTADLGILLGKFGVMSP